MKKNILPLAPTFILIVLIYMTSACSNDKNSNSYLKKVLDNLERIKSATYYQSILAFNPGDTIPYGSRYEYYKEYINPSDTFVGASFLEYLGDDTSKIIYGYDGNIQAWINWDDKTVRTSSFQNQSAPYRIIFPPFFTLAESIIEYALSREDSMSIVKYDYGDSVLYSFSFYDRYIVFLGKIAHPVYDNPMVPNGSPKGKASKYDIFINKSNDLPYKIKTDMIDHFYFTSIKNFRINETIINNLNVSNYFPPDFPMAIGGKRRIPLSELEGKKAPDWILVDTNNDTIALNKLKSKILLIEFTGVGCGPCYAAIGFLRQLVNENKNKDFELVSIEAWNENKYVIKNYHDRYDLNYKLLISTPEITKNYNVYLIPSFFIIDGKRVIRKTFEGYEKGTTDKIIIEEIKALL